MHVPVNVFITFKLITDEFMSESLMPNTGLCDPGKLNYLGVCSISKITVVMIVYISS